MFSFATSGPVQVDVLMVFDEKIQQDAFGNQSAGMLGYLQSEIDFLNNTILPRSGIFDVTFNIVGFQALGHVPQTVGQAYGMLNGSTDGNWDYVHQTRDATQADLVIAYIWEDSGSGECGVANEVYPNRFSTADNAFTVIGYRCARADSAPYVLAHELGHLLGATHDPNHGGIGGYQVPGHFRTLMAYPCAGSICPAIPQFSNPDILYECVPAGTDLQDNARAFRAGVEEASRYRPYVAPTGSCDEAADARLNTADFYAYQGSLEEGFQDIAWVRLTAPKTGSYRIFSPPNGVTRTSMRMTAYRNCQNGVEGGFITQETFRGSPVDFGFINANAGETLLIKVEATGSGYSTQAFTVQFVPPSGGTPTPTPAPASSCTPSIPTATPTATPTVIPFDCATGLTFDYLPAPQGWYEVEQNFVENVYEVAYATLNVSSDGRYRIFAVPNGGSGNYNLNARIFADCVNGAGVNQLLFTGNLSGGSTEVGIIDARAGQPRYLRFDFTSGSNWSTQLMKFQAVRVSDITPTATPTPTPLPGDCGNPRDLGDSQTVSGSSSGSRVFQFDVTDTTWPHRIRLNQQTYFDGNVIVKLYEECPSSSLRTLINSTTLTLQNENGTFPDLLVENLSIGDYYIQVIHEAGRSFTTTYFMTVGNPAPTWTPTNTPTSTPTPISIDIQSGLLGHWDFEEAGYNGTAGEIIDSSGNGNHGTGFGGSLSTVPAMRGKGVRLDGVNDYVRFGSDPNWADSSFPEFTIAFWVRPEGIPSNERGLSLAGFEGLWYLLGYAPTGDALLWGTTQFGAQTYPSVVVNNQWSHLAFAYDPVVGQFEYYLNGNALQSVGASGLSSAGGSQHLDFGRSDRTSKHFPGTFDDIRFYERRLSPGDVAALVNGTPTPTPVQPNLRPEGNSGWSAPLMATTERAARTGIARLAADQNFFLHFTVANDSAVDVTDIYDISLRVGGQELGPFSTADIHAAGTLVGIQELGPLKFFAGTDGDFNFTLQADAGNAVAESDETDNTYTVKVTVGEPFPTPILTPTPSPTTGTPTPGTYRVDLSPGWTAFSVAGVPVSSLPLDSFFADTNATMVAFFGGGRWKVDLPLPTQGSNLLETGKGYMAYSLQQSAFEYTGVPVPNFNHTLERGWNLIGVPKASGLMTASDLIAAIAATGGDCRAVARWDREGWQIHSVGLPFNDFVVNPDEALFIYVTATWSGEITE